MRRLWETIGRLKPTGKGAGLQFLLNSLGGLYDRRSENSKTNERKSDWCCQISTQKIKVETSKNSSYIEIIERQNSKKGFERMSMPAVCPAVPGVFVVLDPSASQYLKVASLTQKIQSSSKLWQVQKWKAEIPDTLLGLTGIGMLYLQRYPKNSSATYLLQCLMKFQPHGMGISVFCWTAWSHKLIKMAIFHLKLLLTGQGGWKWTIDSGNWVWFYSW